MRGTLSETSVADLCRQLADAGATGTLEVDHPTGRGLLSFVDGRLTGAEPPTAQARLGDRLVNAGSLSRQQLDAALADQGDATRPRRLGSVLVERGVVSRDTIRVYVQEQILDALVEMTLRSEGTYEFISGGPVSSDVPADLTVGDALAVVARRREQWERIRGAIADADAVPRAPSPALPPTDRLEPDDEAVLGAVDGRRSIREIAVELGYGTFEAARIVHGLVLVGAVEIRAAAPPVADADLDDEEFERLLDELAQDDTPDGGLDQGAPPAHGPASPAEGPAGGAAPERLAAPDPASPPAEDVPAAGEVDQPVPEVEETDVDHRDDTQDEDVSADEPASVPDDEPVPAPAPSRTTRPGGRNADVSEFLRELSQLTVDDPDGS